MNPDIILQRDDQGLCPICAKAIPSDFRKVTYNGRDIWICVNHHVTKEESNGS